VQEISVRPSRESMRLDFSDTTVFSMAYKPTQWLRCHRSSRCSAIEGTGKVLRRRRSCTPGSCARECPLALRCLLSRGSRSFC
jgi:hypothetical protein